MSVIRRPFPNQFITVPNSEYLFGTPSNGASPLEVMETFVYRDLAECFLTRLGAIGFRFLPAGSFASVERLDFRGTGLIPEEVTSNKDLIVELQTQRLSFANFIAAALFGRVMARRHTAITGAGFSGLDQILTCGIHDGHLVPEPTGYTRAVLGPKLAATTEEAARARVLTRDELRDGVSFILHLADREDAFQYANLQACMVMNYQGAILHNEQHAAASLGLNFAVAEALVKEIFHAYGLAPGATRQAFATKAHTVAALSGNAFRRRSVADLLQDLRDGGMIEPYLHQRLDAARDLRNNLMHGAVPVMLSQSGEAQTAVRDLWALLIDGPFELNAGFTMRF